MNTEYGDAIELATVAALAARKAFIRAAGLADTTGDVNGAVWLRHAASSIAVAYNIADVLENGGEFVDDVHGETNE